MSKIPISKVDVETYDPMYVGQRKLYNIGIKEDPIVGKKVGKGIQHHNSSFWVRDLGFWIDSNIDQICDILETASEYHGGSRCYFLNLCNTYFMESENQGLSSKEFLFASWLAMMAAEVDSFQFSRYTDSERTSNKETVFKRYRQTLAERQPPDVKQIPLCRVDLIPPIAMERLCLHNELCSLTSRNPLEWKRNGFLIVNRVDSLKRHLDASHLNDPTEDHLAHLCWNFMAIYHVSVVFPHCNTLVNYEKERKYNICAQVL